jgi:hypothetical protein
VDHPNFNRTHHQFHAHDNLKTHDVSKSWSSIVPYSESRAKSDK